MNNIYVRLIPKTDTARLIINEIGDHFLVKSLDRHVSHSSKKEWFYLQSEVNKTILIVHSTDDENFLITAPL